jgi:hypothetical protein
MWDGKSEQLGTIVQINYFRHVIIAKYLYGYRAELSLRGSALFVYFLII